MTQEERVFLVERLTASEAQLLALLSPIHDDQWTFHESADRWSLAENLEHLVLFELLVRKVVAHILTEPPSVEASSTVEDAHVLALREAGDTKLKTREAASPTGSLGTPDQMLHRFQRERAETITFAQDVEGDLRAHRFAHLLLGELDGYQWLLVIAQHTERHMTQMKNVIADPNFPR